jgi:hypothetical protein
MIKRNRISNPVNWLRFGKRVLRIMGYYLLYDYSLSFFIWPAIILILSEVIAIAVEIAEGYYDS